MRAKITSIRSGIQGGGTRRLYNIAVRNDESYVVEGLVSHNCRCTDITFMAEDQGDVERSLESQGEAAAEGEASADAAEEADNE